MGTSLHEQIHAAWKLSGLSLPELLAKAKLTCSAVSLSRKLRGLQILATFEAEALVEALDTFIVAGVQPAAAAAEVA